MAKPSIKQDIQKIFDLIQKTAFENQEIFSSIKQSFSEIEQKMVTKDELKAEFKNEFAKFETRMVSKDYLDQKLSDLRGELIEPVKRCEKRLISTLDLLATKKLVTEKEIVEVLS